jgi:hypothetical protein
MPERRPATEQISGVLERVTFHNDDSGFCVLRVETKGHREETVAEGCWVRDREHGLQFKASTFLRQGSDFRSPTLRDVPQQYKNF